MDSKKSNKISEIVRLQQILKKWKKLANTPKNNNGSSNSSSKSINKFLKKTLSFTDRDSEGSEAVPKGFLAVCVGKELKRFIIPTEYLSHQAFGILLREAEEEFGFQQEGVLKIPCDVSVFERILMKISSMVEEKRSHQHHHHRHHHHHHHHHYHPVFFLNPGDHDHEKEMIMNISNGCNYSSDNSDPQQLTPSSHHPQMCR